jgi:predicted acyltransferase
MKQRLLSLDVLRGLTVAAMILVNNGWNHDHFAPLQHVQWNGLTVCDLVFPFFLFMVGVAIYISMSRHASEPGMVKKILKRTILLFVLGVALHAWDMLINGDGAEIPSTLRIWGVLQRIALSYCFAALFFNAFHGKYLWHAIISLLVIYGIILIVGNGYSENPDDNWLAKVDRTLFGNHIYSKVLAGRTPVDPEGLVGTIAGITHALVGVVCGRAIMTVKENKEKIMQLLLIAVSIGLVGYLLTFSFPLNKRIWSPSFTLVTCSMAASLLGIFLYIIDIKGHTKWCNIFRMFGMNALFLYTFSEMIPSVFGVTGITKGIHNFWLMIFGENLPAVVSLFGALTIVAIVALLAWILDKKKIYIKL